MSFRVLVCGGRTYDDRDHLRRMLDRLHAERGPITCLIQGGQSGADELAMRWAQDHSIIQLPFEAEWHKYGRSAGPIRNQRMIDEGKPDLVVAFPGGRGTKNMTKAALAAGLEILHR